MACALGLYSQKYYLITLLYYFPVIRFEKFA